MPRYTVDRFEDGNWAVLEDERGRRFNVPRGWIPSEAREGDVLKVSAQPATEGNTLHFDLDPESREQRLTEVTRRREALPRGPKGDISL